MCTMWVFGAKQSLVVFSKAKGEKCCQIWPDSVARLPFMPFFNFLMKNGNLATQTSKIWQHCLYIVAKNVNVKFSVRKNIWYKFCQLISFLLIFFVKKGYLATLSCKIWQPCLSMAFKNVTKHFIVPKNLNGTDFSYWYWFLEDFSKKW